MNSVCRLHAIEADRIHDLIQKPALVLGESAISGMPICHLRKAWRSLRLLLSEPDWPGECFEDVYDRGRFLGDGNEGSSSSAWLFLPREVERLHRIFSSWNQARLYQRFQQRVMASTAVTSAFIGDAGCFDRREWEDQADPDDWTIEEAEEFECLAETLDVLRQFVANAAFAGQGIVWVTLRGE